MGSVNSNVLPLPTSLTHQIRPPCISTNRFERALREMAEGKNNAAIAEALVLTERSVEKVIHSIFLKLGLRWETAVHKRVKAVVLYLAESS
jgi:DNA-binding NarL/FixJ family response regulator